MDALEIITDVLAKNFDDNTNIFQKETNFVVELDCRSIAKLVLEELQNNDLIKDN